METLTKIKVVVTAIFAVIFNWLGILAVPVFILVGCNLIDYGTGWAAAKYRDEEVNSYKGIKGIIKKVCQWLLIVVGAMIDYLIKYAADTMQLGITIPFIVATIVAVWLITNEMISIIENMVDIGAPIPPFLLPLIKYIKKQAEHKVEESIAEEEDADEDSTGID